MDGRLSPALQTSSPAQRNSISSQALTFYSQAPRKKPNKILRSVKAAVKKFTNIILFRSKGAKTKSTTPDTSSIHRPDVSYSASAPSTETNITSTSTLRHSESYGSSTSLNAQLGTFNFSIKDIHEATGKFSSKYEIGKGGFGIVYKGRFRDGSLVAIKRAKQSIYNPSLSKEFKNEVLTLSRIEHQNLVRLFGYLEHGDERILVLEYVGNGTLKDHLDGRMGNVLEMAERLDIAIDVAHAVTYQLTEKSDVYSFGVLLVELVSGRHPIEQNRPAKERSTVKWAMQKLKEREAVLVMDPSVRRNPASTYAAEAMLKLARQCVAPTRQLRPSMKRCVEVLWEIRKNHRDRVASSTPRRASANFADKKQSARPQHNEDGDRHKYISF